MKINLMYIIIKESSSSWSIFGPELYQGNIKIFRTGYRGLPSESDCIDKMDDMISSLSSLILNITETGVQTFSDFSIRFSDGDLNISSDVPDYTNILTSINTNLTNLNNKFEGNGISIGSYIRGLFNSFNNGSVSDTTQDLKNSSFIKNIHNDLKQSVSPNASITDVISTLNTNIHNDLTNINTTENNKDTVLIIDGQQEFKLHKDDE